MGNTEWTMQICRFGQSNLLCGSSDFSNGCQHRAAAQVIGKQLLRSGTSVAANYRESCRARSEAEMIAKMGIVEQELDESILWIELLGDAEILRAELLRDLLDEAEQLLKMTVSSIKTLKS